jgi:segregation and condensation protein A
MASFLVTTEQYEGPIDALLSMIEKRKLPVNDISLAAITDDYISFLRQLDSRSISDQTHFIVIASTLTLIKSKSILPSIDLSDEEESDIEALKKRLELFSLYQNASHKLKSVYSSSKNWFHPQSSKRKITFQPDPKVTAHDLRDSLREVFVNMPQASKKEPEKAYIRVAVHIEEMMDSLTHRMQKAISEDFSSFIKTYTNETKEPREKKVYNVVGFLAMLELVKKGTLHVLQDQNFSNISIEKV